MSSEYHKPRITLVAACIFCTLAISFRLLRAEGGSDDGPNVYFPVARVTLGKKSESEYQLRVENCGSRRLILNQLDCDCQNNKGLHLVVLPGTSRTLLIDSQESEASSGTDRYIRYATNDPAQPVIEVKFGE